jgi:hypothetical protein
MTPPNQQEYEAVCLEHPLPMELPQPIAPVPLLLMSEKVQTETAPLPDLEQYRHQDVELYRPAHCHQDTQL